MESIDELESYLLYQEINDSFLLISQMIKKDQEGLVIKDTYLITKTNEIILKENKTSEDASIILKWLSNKKDELLTMLINCIKLSEENLIKFKSENPQIRDEVKTRLKDLKKSIKFLEQIFFDEPDYEDFSKLNDFND